MELIESKNFSFKGYNLKMWLSLNKIEVVKVAGVIAGTITSWASGLHPIFVGIIGLALKFGLDGLHYFLDSQEYLDYEDEEE